MSRIHALLARRHSDAIYVPECKMGQAGTRTLDAWVLLPTWSPLTSIGYEIKVSRSDWTRDQKFMEYRPVCHLLMIAAEPGVVKLSELPEGVGLLEAAGKGDGSRLMMRVKPARVEPDHRALSNLMAHVLMWRSRVQHRNDRTETREDRAARWQRWLDDKVVWREIGYHTGRKMRDQIDNANAAKSDAERRAASLEEAVIVLRELGVTELAGASSVRYQIERVMRDQSPEAIKTVDAAIAALSRFKGSIERAMSSPGSGLSENL
jgi:hypothetical protein